MRAAPVFAGVALAATIAVRAAGVADAEQAARDAKVTSTDVLDNDTVAVTRARLAPGGASSISGQTASFLILQVNAGDVDVTQPGETSRAFRPAGTVTYVPAGVNHRLVNIGSTPFDLVTIRIKPTRKAASASPPADPPPGITRTQILDNADARVVRVRFSPDGREPVHTHPHDLLTMQVSRGKLDITIADRAVGDRQSDREPGFVQFVGRNQPHAYSSADTRSFEILSVSIK